jgi:replicative DNA helicase
MQTRANPEIFACMLPLCQDGIPIDFVTIGEMLKIDGKLESVSGITGITNLTYGLPHATSINHLCCDS